MQGGKTNPIRDESLKQLRFSSYWKYLQSPMWKAISRRVLERGKFRCLSCGDRATQVHHKSYDLATMQGRDFTYLVPLCGVCHEAAEFAERGKADLTEANRRLDKLVGATPLPKPKNAPDAWGRERQIYEKTRPKKAGKKYTDPMGKGSVARAIAGVTRSVVMQTPVYLPPKR